MAKTTHRHKWDRTGRLPVGAVRECVECGIRQMKWTLPTGGVAWQEPAGLRNDLAAERAAAR